MCISKIQVETTLVLSCNNDDEQIIRILDDMENVSNFEFP